MPNLFPQGYEEQLAAVSDIERDEPVGYKPSAAFSFETGDFVRNGANQVESASGVEAWEAWCRICLMTPRYSHAAYTTDFGVEIEQAFKAKTRAEAVHARAQDVRSLGAAVTAAAAEDLVCVFGNKDVIAAEGSGLAVIDLLNEQAC